MADQLPIIITMKKEGKELIPNGLMDRLKMEHYVAVLEDGEKVSLMLEQVGDDGTNAQLNYFHKLCRVISEDTGHPLEDITVAEGVIRGVKSEAKIKAGLWLNKTTLKSCADFSKADFTAAIQGAMHLGEDLGLNLNN